MFTHEIEDPYSVGLAIQLMGQGYRFNLSPETATTMNLVQNHITKGEELPFVALTDHQTQGQGRGKGRVWVDKPGKAILMSVGLQITEESTPFFSDLVALQIAAVLAKASFDPVKIKYPNDLVIDGTKVGGVLVRNVYDDTKYLGTNVGIGINVHYKRDELDGYSMEYPATSLGLHTPMQLKRERLVGEITQGLKYTATDAHVFTNNPSNQEVFNQKWRVASAVMGKDVCIQSGDDVLVEGRVADTKIGRGLLIGNSWYDHFDEKTKVRIVS